MSIGFAFTASVVGGKPEGLIGKIAAQATKCGCDWGSYEGDDGLWISFCPMGSMRLNWEQGEDAGDLLVNGECCSTPAGPGFHRTAIEFVDALTGSFLTGLSMDDDTDYFTHRDFERMKGEHFYPWLNTLVGVCTERQAEGEYSSLSLCWDMDEYQPEDIPGTVITPMGRFDIASMADMVQKYGIEWLARRFFIWNSPEKDALYHRNLALHLLWERCCFVPSDRSDSDRNCNRTILTHLESAHELDASLELPLDSYRELCALDGRSPSIGAPVSTLESGFPIGFRRGEITHQFGVLRLTLPGSYRHEWEEGEDSGGCDLWWDSSTESPIWRINGFRRKTGCAQLHDPGEEQQNIEYLEFPNGKAVWGWESVEEDGHLYFQITCEAVSGPSLFLITVTCQKEEEREGIYRLLRKLRAVEE